MKIYKKIGKRLVTTILLIVMLINTIKIGDFNIVKASDEEIILNSNEKISNMFTYNGEEIEQTYIYYKNDNNLEMPVYKLNLQDETIENTTCKLTSENINFNIIWKVMKYGYPYKTLEEMGVSTEKEAYAITQEAIYCLLDIRQITKYSSKNTNNIEAIYKILNNVENDNIDCKDSKIEINEIGGFYKENINGTIYYTQRFELNTIFDIENYNVSIDNAPIDTKILNIYNEEISNGKDKRFKIAIPHKNINDLLKIDINITNLLINTYPIKFTNINDNNYCVSINKSENKENESVIFSKDTKVSTISAKVIFENGNVKKGTKIELKQDNKTIQEGITNDKGIYVFNNLFPGRYSIYEKDSNDNIVGNMPVTLDVLYNEQVDVNVFNQISNGDNIVIENEKKKGTIEIHLINKDNPDINLSNAEIEIYDVEDNLLESLVTDENGIAISSKLPIDKIYRVKQKTAVQDYIIDLNFHRVEFKENDEIVLVEIENNIKKNFIKITKVDKDDNNIKLEGVTFAIYNSENQLVQEIITDKNGEAISTELPINKAYYIKEVKTLDNYVLDDKTITVFLTEKVNSEKEIEEMTIDRLSMNSNNFLILENQRLDNFLPKFGC